MRNKTDFYIAFYERLAVQGFQAYVAYDRKEHIADICAKGYNIAHLTKADMIEPNPYAEGVEAGTIEKIREIAKSTALSCGICTEKPYDEINHHEFSDGSYKLAEYNGMVLACGKHHLFGYLFYTFQFPNEIGQPGERETFFAQSDAAQDFAIKSGLVDERQFFTKADLSAVHKSLLRLLMIPGNHLDSQAFHDAEALIEKTTGIMPELAVLSDISFEAEQDAEHTEVEP